MQSWFDLLTQPLPDTMTTLRVALDWTPNTLHAGLYLALSENLYSSEGLVVQLVIPSPSYAQTPAKLLENGQVDLIICPSESCIAYAESSKPSFKLQAIYAICQRDASAIVTTREDLRRPKDLGENGGATYGSYNARYEDDIVRAMVAHDGGEPGKMNIQGCEGRLSLFDRVRQGDAGVDATWVFMPWEGLEARMEGKDELNVFKPEDYGVPYGYSPVIARNAAFGVRKVDDDVLRRFVKVTQEAYCLAAGGGTVRGREKAMEALQGHCDPVRSAGFLTESLEALGPHYGQDPRRFGYMEPSRWEEWVEWLMDRGFIKDKSLNVEALYTNEFLPRNLD